jgi:hypothetical protein
MQFSFIIFIVRGIFLQISPPEAVAMTSPVKNVRL